MIETHFLVGSRQSSPARLLLVFESFLRVRRRTGCVFYCVVNVRVDSAIVENLLSRLITALSFEIPVDDLPLLLHKNRHVHEHLVQLLDRRLQLHEHLVSEQDQLSKYCLPVQCTTRVSLRKKFKSLSFQSYDNVILH